MPLYDYKCTECGYKFESIQKSDAMEIQCEKCDLIKAQREFPVPQKPKEGLTLADGRIRDKMKYKPRVPGAMFDRGDPRKKF